MDCLDDLLPSDFIVTALYFAKVIDLNGIDGPEARVCSLAALIARVHDSHLFKLEL